MATLNFKNPETDAWEQLKLLPYITENFPTGNGGGVVSVSFTFTTPSNVVPIVFTSIARTTATTEIAYGQQELTRVDSTTWTLDMGTVNKTMMIRVCGYGVTDVVAEIG